MASKAPRRRPRRFQGEPTSLPIDAAVTCEVHEFAVLRAFCAFLISKQACTVCVVSQAENVLAAENAAQFQRSHYGAVRFRQAASVLQEGGRQGRWRKRCHLSRT